MARVLISAAHTNKNPGEIFGDLREADLTREIVKKIVKHLEKTVIKFQAVPLDLDLLQRIEWINSTGYSEKFRDIFIEIHVNDGGQRGIEGWYRGKDTSENKSKKLTNSLLKFLHEKTGYQNQGAKSEYEHELGSLLILNQTNPISTALECFYIDNEEDIKILKDEARLDEFAAALTEGIDNYIKTSATVSSPSKIEAEKPPMQSPQGYQQNNLAPVQPAIKPADPIGRRGLLPFGPSPGGIGSNTMMLDREERKKMISEQYNNVFGKEPDQMELNQYLNSGVTKDQLLSKLVESEDFKKLKADARDASELKKENKNLQGKVTALNSEINSNKSMLDNLNKLLQHKNITIKKLQDELVKNNIILNGQYVDPLSGNLPSGPSNNASQG